MRHPSVAILGVCLVLTACGAAATPTPSPIPTPTPVVGDPAAFVAQLQAMSSLSADLSGTTAAGPLEGDVSGMLEVAETGQHMLMVVTFPGLEPQETETITVNGSTYMREGEIWIRSAEAAGGATAGLNPLEAQLQDPTQLELGGTEELDGERFHRLELTTEADIGPEAFGVTDASGFTADLVFLAEDDGTPAGMMVTASWLQEEKGVEIPVEFELRFRFRPGAVAIEAPEDAFERHVSEELGYSMAYPAGWEFLHEPQAGELKGVDLAADTVEEQAQAVYFHEVPVGIVAVRWFADSTAALAFFFGVEPQLVNDLTLAGGLEVWILTLTYQDQGENFFFERAVVFGGDVAWDVDWHSPAGDEEADAALFLQMVQTFRRAD